MATSRRRRGSTLAPGNGLTWSSRASAAKQLSATQASARLGNSHTMRRIICPARRHGVMVAATRRIEAPRGTQSRQQGQRPAAVGPGYGRPHHTRQPAQATHCDTVRRCGVYGIAVEAYRFTLLAASTCDGVNKAEDDNTLGAEDGH